MTEALNESQIFFLRRAAAAGHVSVETDEDRKFGPSSISELIVGHLNLARIDLATRSIFVTSSVSPSLRKRRARC
jgi:hypothetical protein